MYSLCIYFSSAVVTIGFNKLTYSVLEDTGSVNVTLSILNENLARNVAVMLSTEFGGTATGKVYKSTSCFLIKMCLPFLSLQLGQTTLIQLSP